MIISVLKRLLLGILVLPLSFVILFFLTGALIFFVITVIDFMHLNTSQLLHNPTDFLASLQAGWQDVEAQYAKDSKAFMQSVWETAQISHKKHLSTVEVATAIYAGLGALVFFLSCFGDAIYLFLLPSRRIITVPILFTYFFIITVAILYVIALNVCLAVVRTSSVPGATAQNVADFYAHYENYVVEGSAALALIIAVYYSYRLARWDGLPWCRNPLPVTPQRRSRPKP